MKVFSLFLTLITTSILTYAQKDEQRIDTSFTLSYISVGLGSNMFDLHPVFRVKGTKYVYTIEEAWQFKNKEKAKPDTLYRGNLSASSVDSISALSKEIKGDSVFKWRTGTMSGDVILLDITSQLTKLNFRLDNAFDPTAQKIIDILNNYIPDKRRKLWISDLIPNIISIK